MNRSTVYRGSMFGMTAAGIFGAVMCITGSSFAADPKPAAPAAEKPAAKPAEAAPASPKKLTDGASLEGKALKLDGITMTVPDGWEAAPVQTTAMGPVAIFTLAKAEGESEPAQARITYYPSMKGKDDENIERWLKQVKQADGSAHTRDTAKITKTEQGNVRVTVVDISGTVDNSMAGGGQSAGTRMLAAIVDHPKGPHYIKVTGSLKTMEKWQQAVDTFFKSAKVVQ